MSRTILIVDDHVDIRRLIRMTLEFEGYQIHEAADGPSALQLARDLLPDVVLLDVMMSGGLSGLEVCRELKNDPRCAGMQVILLSARSQASDRAAGLEAGADAYMVKPFSPMQLIEHLAGLDFPN